MEAFKELPNEVVAEVFYQCLPTTTYNQPDIKNAPLLLTRVCSSWRKLAHHTPILWSSLRMECRLREKCNHSFQNCRDTSFRQYEHWRRHGSEGLPFDLQIIFPPSQRDRAANGALVCFENLISTVAQNTSNIRKLCMNGGEIQDFGPLLSLTPSSMPRLEAVHLSFWFGHNNNNDLLTNLQFVSKAPHLRKVILDYSLPEELGEIVVLPFAQLTHLVITLSISHTKFSNLLADCPLLNELSCTLYSYDGMPRRGVASINSTALRLLDVTLDFNQGTPTPEIFLFASFPCLESFTLRTASGGNHFQWNHAPARDHLFEQLRNLSVLKLGFQKISYSDLLDLVNLTPNLIKLVIDSPNIDYVQLLSALTYTPLQWEDKISLLHLEHFELYVEFTAEPESLSPLFTPSQFMTMVTSRSLSITSTHFDAPVPLKRVHVFLDSATHSQKERVGVESLKKSARDFQATDNQLTLTILDSVGKNEWMNLQLTCS